MNTIKDVKDDMITGRVAKVRLRLGHMEAFGDHSLTGAIVNQNDDIALAEITLLLIEVEVTSSGWKRDNKGPHLTLMPESVPICLISDVLSLVQRGIRIQVYEVIADPS